MKCPHGLKAHHRHQEKDPGLPSTMMRATLTKEPLLWRNWEDQVFHYYLASLTTRATAAKDMEASSSPNSKLSSTTNLTLTWLPLDEQIGYYVSLLPICSISNRGFSLDEIAPGTSKGFKSHLSRQLKIRADVFYNNNHTSFWVSNLLPPSFEI